jgi:cyclophilin family peptidyl-prolyl cis-trans isomerase
MKVGPMTIAVAIVAAMAGTAAAGQTRSTGARRGASGGGAARGATNPNKAKLLTPSQLNEKAPDVFKATLDTTKGPIVIEVHRDWAPLGADRFYNLVKNGYYDEVRFFRVIPNFMAQFGINGDPAVTTAWRRVVLNDDPVKQSNKRGFVSYGNTGQPNSRGTQLFINYKDNSFLDEQRFAPFGEVISGMEAADKLNSEYGSKPQDAQGTISTEGNKFLMSSFPKLDYIRKATIEK